MLWKREIQVKLSRREIMKMISLIKTTMVITIKGKGKVNVIFVGKNDILGMSAGSLRSRTKKKNSRATNDDFVAVIFEINMIEDVDSSWIDSGATRHVCKKKKMFKTINEDGSVLYMRNASTVQVQGKGTIKIEFTFERHLLLKMYFMFLKLGRT